MSYYPKQPHGAKGSQVSEAADAEGEVPSRQRECAWVLGVRVAVTSGEEGLGLGKGLLGMPLLLVMKCCVLFWVCLCPKSSSNFMITSDLCASLDIYYEYNSLRIDEMGIMPTMMYSVQ